MPFPKHRKPSYFNKLKKNSNKKNKQKHLIGELILFPLMNDIG